MYDKLVTNTNCIFDLSNYLKLLSLNFENGYNRTFYEFVIYGNHRKALHRLESTGCYATTNLLNFFVEIKI